MSDRHHSSIRNNIDSVKTSDHPPFSIFHRLRLVLWMPHQRYLALMLSIGLISMAAYFAQRAYVNGGLIEIDGVGALEAEFKVDINQADWSEIVVLPGVGKKLAQAIVEHRREKGPFDSPEALMDVSGIGEKKLELLRPYLLPLQSPHP